MKILITGGAGFIGSNLAEKIIKKHKVVVIDNFNDTYNPTQKRKNIKEIKNNKNYTLYEIDLRNKEEINKVFQKEKKFDCIIHLAGVGGVRPSEENPTFYYEENVISTINLVEVMKQYNCKNIIYFSSSSVYGNSNKNKFKETDITDTPVSIYAATKRSSEIMLYNYYINYHFNIVIIRPFTVYGPRQRPDLAIHTFTKKILNNEEITIFGDGSMIRDYTYVDDIVDGVIKAIDYMKTKKEQYEIFNLASSNPNSINKMVDIIQEITNKKAIIKYEKKPIGDVNKTYGDISKAKKILNWTPQKNFKEGITNFIKWYKKENKKKIVFYTMAMIKGGTERTIANLSNYFIKDYDITIITNINGPIEYELNNQIKIIPIDDTDKRNEKIPKKIITKTSKKRTKKLLNILQEENPDIVIVTLPEPTIRVLSIKKHLKNTIIITSIRNHPNSEFKSFIGKSIRNHYYKNSDIITIQDNHYKKYFQKYLQNKIEIIPNYISNEFFSNKKKRKKEKKIITVTRLEKQKNIPLLINAYSKLNKKYNDYKLVIIGKGNEKQKLLKLIKKKKLIEKVIIKEPTNNIKEELETSTLFVLTSNYEGMPNVLLEAMSSSLPVITTNSTEALKTFIINNKNGIIVPKKNQKELTKAIEYLLEKKEIRNKLNKEALKIKELYNENRIIKKWESILKKEEIKKKKKKNKHIILLLLLLFIIIIYQYHINKNKKIIQMEYLNRGTIAIKINKGVYLSWRLLGTDNYNTKFYIYKNNKKIKTISNKTNYIDKKGNPKDTYYVLTDNKSEEIIKVKALNHNYITIPLEKPKNGIDNNNNEYFYSPNDATCADLDGDGEYEIILKWDPSNSFDSGEKAKFTGNVYIDAYKLNGDKLWRIDLGKNISAGAHFTQIAAYDFDLDGKAELALKTAPGSKDGKGNYVSYVSKIKEIYQTNNNIDYRENENNNKTGGRVLSGDEYFTLFQGESGKAIDTIYYPNPRGNIKEWGDDWGNRSERYLTAIAYLDGINPAIITWRGYYEKTTLTAFQVKNKRLIKISEFDSSKKNYKKYNGQGNHNLSVGDIDNDGKDEILSGSIALDDSLQPLWSSLKGHGDAQHLADYDPLNKGMEYFVVHENKPYGSTLYDAKTGKILFHQDDKEDTGRGMMAHIGYTDGYFEIWTNSKNMKTYASFGNNNIKQINYNYSSTNFRIFWNEDLFDELLDGNENDNVQITNKDGILETFDNIKTNNGTKKNVSLTADLFGDWREEIIAKNNEEDALLIYTTTIPTKNKLYTLMHDRTYRMQVATQNVGYNQPPHIGYFISNTNDKYDKRKKAAYIKTKHNNIISIRKEK